MKRKRGNKVLADLAKPGDEVLVARGGRGGVSFALLALLGLLDINWKKGNEQ